jgi:hypothetical protein
MRFSNPLKTDKTTINAIVPKLTPVSATHVSTFTAVCDFLAKRYRRDM